MAKSIQLLSETTINQIAAGEVIENPASVVKELIENSIDAKSTHIHVGIQAGGFQSILIRDDGHGMSPEDAALSLERHATSKIASSDDLFTLSTMGFRGEALASIAAISKLKLTTSQDGQRATLIEVEGGKVVNVTPAAHPKGTTIEVRSLFYNTPARKKFQKSPRASQAEITKMLTQLSLAHPLVGFTLIHGGKEFFSFSPKGEEALVSELKRRTETLIASELIEQCHLMEFEESACSGVGLISEPTLTRHNRSGQYLFINHRPILSLPLGFAIKNAYGTRLSPDRFPIYLLHLFIPADQVDVNVHPQKKEVRLQEEDAVKSVLHRAVNRCLQKKTTVEVAKPFQTLSFSEQPFTSLPSLSFKETAELIPQETSLPLSFFLKPLCIYKHFLLTHPQSLPSHFPISKEQGIAFVDLIAAQKRSQFESLLAKNSSTPAQGLLIPLTLNFSLAEAEKLSLSLPLLSKIGFALQRAGKQTFLLEALPPFLDEAKAQETLLDLIAEQKTPSFERLALRLTDQITFRGQSFSEEEGSLIMNALLRTEDPHHCPRGKPTYFLFKEAKLYEQFC